MHTSSGRWQLGLSLALITACLWGLLPIALSMSLQVLDVYTIVWFRFGVAFVIVASSLGIRRGLGVFTQLPKRRFRVQSSLSATTWGLLAIATLFLGLNYWLFMVGLDLTSSANAEVLIQLAPLLLALGGMAVLGEQYRHRQWLGLGVSIGGMSVFMHDAVRVADRSVDHYWVGSAAIGLAAVTWAVYALAQKQLLLSLTSGQITVVIYGGCAVMFTALASPAQLGQQTASQWAALLFCCFNTVVAYGAFAESLNHWEASRISAVIALTPVLTLLFVTVGSALWPAAIAAESLSLWSWLGAAVVVGGSWLVALGR